ncbi:MAG: phage major capsid protein [bacterium JZ-2024 1]
MNQFQQVAGEIVEAARKAALGELPVEEGEHRVRAALARFQKQVWDEVARRQSEGESPESETRTPEDPERAQNLRERADNLLLGSALTGRPIRSLKAWRQFEEDLRAFGKAMDTLTGGAGAEWVPTALSPDLAERVSLALKVASLHPRITMPTDPFKIPRMTAGSQAYLKSENQEISASHPATGQASLDAKTLAVLVPVSYELEEDSVFALLPVIKRDLVRAIASGIETAIINGDTTTPHLDADVVSASDVRKAWNGYRKLASVSLDFGGTLSADKLRTLRGMMRVYAVDPADLAWVVSVKGYLQLLSLKDNAGNPVVMTVDKYGPRATLLTGELGRLDGIPVIVSEFVRDDLNASGVYDGVTTNKTVVLLVYRPGFVVGERRVITVESTRDIRTGTLQVVASARIGFVDRLNATTEPIVARGYNLTVA